MINWELILSKKAQSAFVVCECVYWQSKASQVRTLNIGVDCVTDINIHIGSDVNVTHGSSSEPRTAYIYVQSLSSEVKNGNHTNGHSTNGNVIPKFTVE